MLPITVAGSGQQEADVMQPRTSEFLIRRCRKKNLTKISTMSGPGYQNWAPRIIPPQWLTMQLPGNVPWKLTAAYSTGSYCHAPPPFKTELAGSGSFPDQCPSGCICW